MFSLIIVNFLPSVLSLLSLMCQSVVSSPPIQHIRGVTLEECGIGRESQLFDDTCFQWHRMVYAKNDIQNGRNATIGEMPYIAMVYVMYKRPNETKWISHICGATILNNRWLITAAHCMYCYYEPEIKSPCNISHYNVIIGNMTMFGGQLYRLEHSVRHYRYRHHGIGTYNDIGLLMVDRNITMIKYHVAPVCLPQYKYHNTEEEYGLIAGWGRTALDPKVPLPEHLQIGWVKIEKSHQDVLDKRLNKFIEIKRTPPINGTSICRGDSGSPLIQYYNGRAVLTGIASRFDEIQSWQKCLPEGNNTLSLMTRVSYYIPWIKHHVESYSKN